MDFDDGLRTGERRAYRRFALGFALLFGPMTLYPGNWSDVGPLAAGAQASWALVGALVFASITLGAVLVFGSWRTLLGLWRGRAPGTVRRSIADALAGRRERRTMAISAAAYVLLVGAFLSVYGWSSGGPGIWASAYPSAQNVLCCGPVGETPAAILIVAPSFELVTYPIVMVTVFLATLLFSMNVAMAMALLSRRVSGPTAVGGASVGTVSALLVNCPSCGTILLANLLAGTAGAGLLVAWAAYSVPLMLLSFPLSLLALAWSSRRLSRADSVVQCSTAGSLS